MNDFLVMVIRSPGWIFGPLMLLSGLVAFVVCVRATARAERAAARRALRWSLVPPALGVVGAIVGGIVWVASGAATDPARARMALFCTFVFGVFCAAIPMLWSLALLQRRPAALA